jgi:predicted alpha/beta hydrolase family esterase
MKQLVTILLAFLCQLGWSQKTWEIELKDGHINSQGYYLEVKNQLQFKTVSTKEEWQSRLNDSIKHGSEVFIFLHAMWGSNPQFHSMNLKHFNQYVLKETPVNHVLYIRWKAPALEYFGNLKRTIPFGESAQPELDSIINLYQSKNCKVNIMAHSMGNRILLGWLSKSKLQVNKILLMAPDISPEELESINYYSNHADETFVFYNKRDLFLDFSEILTSSNRLGKHPPLETLQANLISVVDCSNLKDLRGYGSRFSKHLYYKDSQWVTQQWQQVLRR